MALVFTGRAARWAHSPFQREELPARAYYAADDGARYAADDGARDILDEALFAAAWVEGMDVNEPEAIRWAAAWAGLDGDALLAAAEADYPGAKARAALSDFDIHACPGVPTVMIRDKRFFGKDRIEWIIEAANGGGNVGVQTVAGRAAA